MSGKGSGRRPGDGYASGWDAIFGKKEPKRECKCSLTISLLGDGCDVCNPKFWEEFDRRAAEEDEGNKDE